MFKRHDQTYELDFSNLDIQAIMADDASPLKHIVDLVPDGSRVLDIGAGNGMLAWLFHTIKPGVIVDGIEPNSRGAELSRSHYRQFWNGFFQDFSHEIQSQSYDFVIMADVIEHVVDPEDFIADLIRVCGSTNYIFSIPNVAHYSVRLNILNGTFEYTDSGLLEKTHLRFFTIDTIKNVMSRNKLSISKVYRLQRTMPLACQKIKFRLGLLAFLRMVNDQEARTFQYLLVCNTSVSTCQETVHSSISWKRLLATMLLSPHGFLYRFFKGKGK